MGCQRELEAKHITSTTARRMALTLPFILFINTECYSPLVSGWRLQFLPFWKAQWCLSPHCAAAGFQAEPLLPLFQHCWVLRREDYGTSRWEDFALWAFGGCVLLVMVHHSGLHPWASSSSCEWFTGCYGSSSSAWWNPLAFRNPEITFRTGFPPWQGRGAEKLTTLHGFSPNSSTSIVQLPRSCWVTLLWRRACPMVRTSVWGLGDWVWHLEPFMGSGESHLISIWERKMELGYFQQLFLIGAPCSRVSLVPELVSYLCSQGRERISLQQLQLTVLLHYLQKRCDYSWHSHCEPPNRITWSSGWCLLLSITLHHWRYGVRSTFPGRRESRVRYFRVQWQLIRMFNIPRWKLGLEPCQWHIWSWAICLLLPISRSNRRHKGPV